MSVVGGGGDGSGAYEPAQKHKVTPGMPGDLKIQLWVSIDISIMNILISIMNSHTPVMDIYVFHYGYTLFHYG